MHFNVQSIANKLDFIESEQQSFNVISVTETLLDGRISDEDIKFENFNLFRRDRPGDHHRGICICPE